MNIRRKFKGNRSGPVEKKVIHATDTPEFARIKELMDNEEWEDAKVHLFLLEQRFPFDDELIVRGARCAVETDDAVNLTRWMLKFKLGHPDDADATLRLALAYIASGHPFLGVRSVDEFLERWPDHPEAERAKQVIFDLKSVLHETLHEFDMSPEDALELATESERAQFFYDIDDYIESRRHADLVIKKYPFYSPVYITKCEAFFHEGKLSNAVETIRALLTAVPDDVPGLCLGTRICSLAGKKNEAARYAKALKVTADGTLESSTVIADALSFLEDFEGVIEVYERFAKTVVDELEEGDEDYEDVVEDGGFGSEDAIFIDDEIVDEGDEEFDDDEDEEDNETYLLHLAAVAHARLGHDSESERLWIEALGLDPSFDTSLDNLNDSEADPGERHGPFAHSIGDWFPTTYSIEIAKMGERTEMLSPEGLERMCRALIQRFPEIIPITSFVLRNGDPDGTAMMLEFSVLSGDSRLINGVREFAFDQRGSDRLRIMAVKGLMSRGWTPRSPILFWLEGKRQEVDVQAFEEFDYGD